MSKLTVIASHATPTDKALRMSVLSSYQCGSCKNDTVALAACEPFCSHCGSPAMKERQVQVASLASVKGKDLEMTSAKCTNCLVANVMLDAELAHVARDDDGHVEICCVECGTGMKFNPDVALAGADDSGDDADDSDDADSDDSDWAWDGDQPASEEADVVVDPTDGDTVDDDTVDTSIDDLDPLFADEDEGTDDFVIDGQTDDEFDDGNYVDEASAGDNPMIIMPKQQAILSAVDDDSDDGDDADEDDSDETDDEDDPDAETADVIQSTQNPLYQDDTNAPPAGAAPGGIDVDVLDTVTASLVDGQGSVAFIPMDTKILATVEDQTVAVLHKTAETANADIFGTDGYMEALASVVNSQGLEQALASYGFQRMSFKASPEFALAYVREHAVASVNEASSQNFDKHVAKLAQGLQLATAGMTRGLFRGTPHRIKDRLIADLAAAGVQGAQGLVERALAATEDEHNMAVLELAQTLAVRSTESLNDLAETIASVNPVGDTSRTQGNTPKALEESLAEPLRQVTTASFLQTQPAAQGNSIVRNLAGQHAGKLFSSR